jgi:hypothetical protein
VGVSIWSLPVHERAQPFHPLVGHAPRNRKRPKQGHAHVESGRGAIEKQNTTNEKRSERTLPVRRISNAWYGSRPLLSGSWGNRVS